MLKHCKQIYCISISWRYVIKVAIIGSRSILHFDIAAVLPEGTTEIITGGASGVDTLAQSFAEANSIPCTIILPNYTRYGRAAPIRRNDEIIAQADLVIAIWNGTSRGTRYVINRCRRLNKPLTIHELHPTDPIPNS